MVKVYERINWENEPSLNTPLSEGNLNRMDLALDTIDTRVVSHETTKLDVSVANTMVKNVTYEESTGIITVTYLNGTTATLDTKLEKLAVNFRYDPETEKLIITLDDGTTQEVDLSSLITEYDFENTNTVAFTVENGVVKAMIPDGAITGDKLEPNYLANCESAKATAETKALVAEGYSVGTQNGQPVGPDSEYYQNNAKYYKEQAKQIAGDVSLESLTDVSLNDVQDGDVLVWNADTQKWVNGQGSSPTPKEIDVTLTLEGAKNDTITITKPSGENVGVCMFNDSTSGEVTVTISEEGTELLFTSSVAKDLIDNTKDYVKSAFVDGKVVKRLPDGYSELEYIESTGTQYIDTGIKASSEVSVDIDVFYPFGYTSCILGGRDAVSTNVYGFTTASANAGTPGHLLFQYEANADSLIKDASIYVPNGERVTLSTNKNSATAVVGNTTYTRTFTAKTFESLYTMCLFALNEAGTKKFFCKDAKIYSAKIYVSEALVRNFIPCRRLSDNTVGMYDLVTNAFFENGGTGTFVGGKRVDIPSVKVMPDGALYWYGNFKTPYTWFGIAPLSVSQRTHFVENTNSFNLYSDNGNVNSGLEFNVSQLAKDNLSKLKIHYISWTANNSSYNYVTAFLEGNVRVPQSGNYVESDPNYLRDNSNVKFATQNTIKQLGRLFEHSTSGSNVTYTKDFTQAEITETNSIYFVDWYMGQNLIDSIWLE